MDPIDRCSDEQIQKILTETSLNERSSTNYEVENVQDSKITDLDASAVTLSTGKKQLLTLA